MPDTQAFLNQVHKSIEAAQAEGGMTRENIIKVQKNLAYYKEMGVQPTGVLDAATKKGVQAFYSTYYESPNNSEKNIIAGEMKKMPGYST
jgi:cell division septum initiation protein DivIVA